MKPEEIKPEAIYSDTDGYLKCVVSIKDGIVEYATIRTPKRHHCSIKTFAKWAVKEVASTF